MKSDSKHMVSYSHHLLILNDDDDDAAANCRHYEASKPWGISRAGVIFVNCVDIVPFNKPLYLQEARYKGISPQDLHNDAVLITELSLLQ